MTPPCTTKPRSNPHGHAWSSNGLRCLLCECRRHWPLASMPCPMAVEGTASKAKARMVKRRMGAEVSR